jgi:biotin carboxyl carrier protein
MKTYKFTINNEKYKAKILEYKGDNIRVEVNGIEYKVELETESINSAPKLIRSEKPRTSTITPIPVSPATGVKGVKAPIPGLVHSILIQEGAVVNKGEPVVILEAMKMESEISSSFTGKVKKIMVKEGDTVQEGQILIEIEE